jgi:hypothetical protein
MMRPTLFILPLLLAMGCKGPEGPAGVAGSDGSDGVDGSDGTDGADGQAYVWVETDTQWEGEVFVAGTVMVREGATLTLAAGTQITVGPNSRLLVEGGLISEGTEAEPVSLQSHGNQFSRLTVYGSATLQHMIFDRVHLKLEGNGVEAIESCTFNNVEVVVLNRDADFAIRNAQFSLDRFWHEYNLMMREMSGATLIESSTFVGGHRGISWEWIDPSASLTVKDSDFSQHYYGILAGTYTTETEGMLTLDNVTMHDLTYSGLDLRQGSAVLNGVTIWDAQSYYGITTSSEGSLSLTDVDVSDTGRTCIYSRALALTAVRVTVQNCGSRGIHAVDGALTADNVRAINNESDGIYAQSLLMTNSTISDNGISGVNVAGSADSSIENSDISGNVEYGVRGSTGDNALDMSGNNVVGNGKQGANEVRWMSGNYLADNNGQTGPDTGSGGDLDGVRNTDTAQVNDADQIANPLAEAITGTGATE